MKQKWWYHYSVVGSGHFRLRLFDDIENLFFFIVSKNRKNRVDVQSLYLCTNCFIFQNRYWITIVYCDLIIFPMLPDIQHSPLMPFVSMLCVYWPCTALLVKNTFVILLSHCQFHFPQVAKPVFMRYTSSPFNNYYCAYLPKLLHVTSSLQAIIGHQWGTLHALSGCDSLYLQQLY